METNYTTTEFPNFFARERYRKASNIEEALELCDADFSYSRSKIAVEQISLEKNLSIRFNGEQYQLTEKAFTDLCKVLGVPPKFAKEIPTELTVTIVDKLKSLHEQQIVLIYRDNVVVGVINPSKFLHSRAKKQRPHYLPVTNLQTLQLIKNVWNNSGNTASISISDAGLRVEAVDPEQTIEPKSKPGDITNIGLSVTSSETGGPMLQAKGYTLRLVCTNGATVPENFGLLRFNTDWRVNIDYRLDNFGKRLLNFKVDVEDLKNSYDRLTVGTISEFQFYSIYRQARYIYKNDPEGELKADKTLDVKAEERKEIFESVRKRQAEIRGLATDSIEPPQQTNFQAWDVFNSITAQARRETYINRVALERLGGDMIQIFGQQRLS